jgi:arylsulfatase A-like enzyme
MKRPWIILLFIVTIYLSAAADVVLFSDSFDRANSNDIDASPVGMTGLLSPLTYVEIGDDVIYPIQSGTGNPYPELTHIENNRLYMADGTNMTTMYLGHNFVDNEILAADGMRIGLTIIENRGTGTTAQFFVGFGVGNTLQECQSTWFDHNGTGFRGQVNVTPPQAGTSDLWVGWSPANGGTIQVFKNGPTAAGGENYDLLTGVALTGSDRLELELYFNSFADNTPVLANILWNKEVVGTETFAWDADGKLENYIGINGRQGNGYIVDDLLIETLTGTVDPVVSDMAALPRYVQSDETDAPITLKWTTTFTGAGTTYAVTADKAVTFPNGDNTGPAVNGQTSIDAVVNGTLGNTKFTVTIYEDAVAVSSASTIIHAIPKQNPATPNFIVIFTDDQGWGTTSVQIDPEVPESRSDFFETPSLERLAQSGIRFTQAYSPHPNCSPSRAALLTGRSPAALHFTDIVGRNTGPFYEGNPMIPAAHINDLPAGESTIPELLKLHNSAYTAAHFGKWHVRGGSPEVHGFDASDGATGNGAGDGNPPDDPKQVFGIAQRGNDWMETQVFQGKPFYLQLSHYATHLAIAYRSETKAYFDAKTPGIRHQHPGFAAMLYDLDEAIGRTMDKVAELGIQDNTYIIYTADNGTYPLANNSENINGPIRGWKATVWEGGVRVPFIVAGPGIDGNTISREPVVGYDILPTICRMAGIDPADLPPLVEGGSFAHILQGGTEPISRSRDGLVFHWPHYQHDKFSTPDSTLLLDGYKLHYRWETRKSQLFHLDQDLAETTDLARLERPLVGQMTQALHQHLNTIGAVLPVANPNYTPICWDASNPAYPPDDFMGRDPSPYDINRNCRVEAGDLDILINEWLQNTPAYDFDGSSRVDLGDFARIAEDWLGCWWLPVDLNCL